MTRRLFAWFLIAGCLAPACAEGKAATEEVQRWGIFELALEGPREGNPFMDVKLGARFTRGDRVLKPEGFYDGDGVYRVRFMPDELGRWTYTTQSNRPELDGKSGVFTCVKPSPGNRGPVRVFHKTHFAYADGTPYFQVGTTCYAWVHQGDQLEEQTLATLGKSPFNKIRMCVFPKSYAYNKNEPQFYPFPRTRDGKNDYTRFNPEFFRHFEKRVGQLRDLGIEADLILFHPYDRWGYSRMDARTDDRYLRYVVARLAAYRNVWWSLANEFDLMRAKKMEDWDRFFQIVQKHDPYGHLRGIHNCGTWYDHSKPWVTHASIQSSNFGIARNLPGRFQKPCIYDECRYEGNIPQGWGNISAEEMTHRFWLGAMAGCYVGHGETYKHPRDILWWSKGGVLHGQSPARIAFFKKIMQASPYAEMQASGLPGDNHLLARPGLCYYVYFPERAPVRLRLAGGRPYRVDGFDTWQMTQTSHGHVPPGEFNFVPPVRRYLLRLSGGDAAAKLRPDLRVSATPAQGTVPLAVQFKTATPPKGRCRWDFDDGSKSTEAAPSHTYRKPGRFVVTLSVTDEKGTAVSLPLSIVVRRPPGEPLVRVGCKGNNYPPVKLHGNITRAPDGSYELGDGPPWKWITVGQQPISDLEGLQSLTILGWAKASSLAIGRGGNRIAFNLNYNRAGFDLVQLADGRLRLSINEWPDHVRNDSSPEKVRVGGWVFFAVSYDAGKPADNVCWYFGDARTPAAPDRTTTYGRGPTGQGSGPLTIGNYNRTIHRHGLDRQFRGCLRGIRIFGSRTDSGGVLSLDVIRKLQEEE